MPFDASPVETDSVVLALMRAKQRIEDPKNWCIDAQAMTAGGEERDACAEDAVQFCAVGTLGREYGLEAGSVNRHAAYPFLLAAANALGATFPAEINWRGDHALVMSMFDRAIALRRAEEARRG